jgi:hypothetical protein
MISGARELMTPGAWVKQGSTYKLRETELSVANRQAKLVSSRVERLRELHRHLTLYADGHDGAYPPSQEGAGIDYSHWRIVDLPPGTSLVYVPGRRRQGPPQPLAYEPEVYDSDPFVLLTDGRIEPMRPIEIKRLVEAIQ